MTPDEARRLLEGTTPGPWIPSKSGYIGSAAGVMIHDGHVLGDTDADTCLIAAAPALAAMIAGMHEEWIGQYVDHDGKWATICAYPTREEVAHHLDHGCWDAYTHTRITRRYVTEPEVIE